MRKLTCLVLIALWGVVPAIGQLSLSLNANLIPDSLKEGSNAVIRYYSTSYKRESLEDYRVEVKYAVTVLNARGKHAAQLVIPYDRNSEVSDIKGTLYDENGIGIDKLKKKDLKDYPSNPSYTLFSDNRVKTVSPAYQNYPFTIEYSYTIRHDATVGFGNWMPMLWFKVSTEKAELHVSTPKELDIRYKALNHPFEFTADSSGEVYTYSWKADNLKSLESGPYLPHYLDYMPVVMLAPNEISFEGSTGSYRTWQEYGSWVYSLIRDRDHVPAETVTRMRQLTDTIADARSKVKAIYQYMQSRTRYVNVALGIGGFQPLHAWEVDEKGYGDCKALSNYTRALLKCVGIPSYYAEIGSGRSRELKYPDFASVNQTNHIILCVPLHQDTVWLECTSQSIPFGFIGTGNSDRYALLVGETGGKLVRTPSYPSSENIRVTQSRVAIDADGQAYYQVDTDFKLAEYDDISSLLVQSPKEQRESLLEDVALDGFSMGDFSVQKLSSGLAEARISLDGTVSRYASKSGKRLFLRPVFPFSVTNFREIPEDREQDMYRAVGYHHVDTVSFHIPENYQIERLPKRVSQESAFGNFSMEISEIETGIQIIRELEMFQGSYDPSQFEAYNTFTKVVSRSDQSRIIICQQ